jgi:putative peptidoglycan binding protein/resolvase-like protein
MGLAPRRRFAGLAAVVTVLLAAPAQAAGSEQRPAATPAGPPLPAASWHGRPIQRPGHDGAVVVQAVQAGANLLRPGAGYGQAAGSPAVREVQRLLRQIGYRPGPLDGRYGPLTRSSVQWFQIKHGLAPTGAVGAAELALLRLRADGRWPDRLRGVRLRTAVRAPAHPAAGEPALAVPVGGGPPVLPVLLSAALLGLLAAGGLVLAHGRRPGRLRIPGRRDQRATQASASAVGYLRSGGEQEQTRRAEAIRRACAERGWAITRIVREGCVNGTPVSELPGLSFAFDELARKDGGRLVACRLDDVGKTRRELATVLQRCSRSGVDLVALDVGLDTGTSAGDLAARCLVAVGDNRRSRPRRRSAKAGVRA